MTSEMYEKFLFRKEVYTMIKIVRKHKKESKSQKYSTMHCSTAVMENNVVVLHLQYVYFTPLQSVMICLADDVNQVRLEQEVLRPGTRKYSSVKDVGLSCQLENKWKYRLKFCYTFSLNMTGQA